MIKYSDIETLFANKDLVVYEYNVLLDKNEQIEVPFLTYQVTSGDYFGADGINYINLLNVSLAIIDETMNFPLQRRVESVLNEAEISFDKNTNFDDEERLYAITYNFVVFDDGTD